MADQAITCSADQDRHIPTRDKTSKHIGNYIGEAQLPHKAVVAKLLVPHKH